MKKLIIVLFAMAVAMTAGQAFALPGVYNMGDDNMTLVGTACEDRVVSLDATGCGEEPFVSGGFFLQNDNPDKAGVTACDCSAAIGSLWDQPVLVVFDVEGYPGSVYVPVVNLGAGVPVSNNIIICEITICGKEPGTANLCVDTIPDFATWVNEIERDPYIDGDCVAVQVVGDPCECSIAGPATIEGDALNPVTQQYTASGDAQCVNPPVYNYAMTCTGSSGATINATTGLVTVPPTTVTDSCTITVTDTANTDINTGEPVVCTRDITIAGGSLCSTVIALGRECPGEAIDDPAYNRPGRRGLAATCGDIIDFTVCSDDKNFDPADLTWTITPSGLGTITQFDDCCWRLIVGNICDDLEKTATFTVTVADGSCASSDSVEIEVGKVIVDIGETTIEPNSQSATVDINLTNLNHSVRAISLDIAACSGDDNLVCTECVIDPDRALQFTCSANEQPNGTCRVVLYSTNPAALITQGRGAIAQVVYEAGPELNGVCGEDACIDLCPINIKVSDQFNEDLCPCPSPGEVCFRTCGDIYPQDCIGGTCGAKTCCGDGVIDLFDILEAVDIILGLQVATPCQLFNGDVPNGMPPYCGNPPGTPNCQGDGDIDIFDVLVMIDKALGKMNCCDYCSFGRIF